MARTPPRVHAIYGTPGHLDPVTPSPPHPRIPDLPASPHPAKWIFVNGALRIGTEDDRYEHRAVITLTGRIQDGDIGGVGNRMIAVSPFGTIDVHGESRLAWTKLGATAEVGSDQLLLERSVDWRVGDRIVVASTDFDPFHAEDRIVTAVDDDLITLDESLEYQHFGMTQSIEGWTVAYECPNRYFRLQVRSENGDDVAPLSVV